MKRIPRVTFRRSGWPAALTLAVALALALVGCDDQQPRTPEEQPREPRTVEDIEPPPPPKYDWQEAREMVMGPTRAWVAEHCKYLPLDAWVGQKFIFLPLPPEQREIGYPAFRTEQKFIGIFLSADQAEGKTGTVQKVSRDEPPTITMTLENGETITGRVTGLGRGGSTRPDPAFDEDGNPLPRDGTITGIALKRDLDAAREAFLAPPGQPRKSLYFIGPIIRADTPRSAGGTRYLDIPRYDPVQVIDISPSSSTERPVRFTLRTRSGEEGYVDINMSGTNVPRPLREAGRFEDNFLIEDPREKLEWDAEMWDDYIARGSTVTGMTQAQVWAAKGAPDEIEFREAREDKPEKIRWLYLGTQTLIFEDGRLADAITHRRLTR